MKKFWRLLLCFILVLSLLLCFAACDSSSSRDDDDEDEEEDIYDRYELVYVDYDGQIMEARDIGEEDAYIELEDDGTAEMYLDGEEMDMEWEDDEIWPEDKEDEPAEFKVRKGCLYLYIEDITYVFATEDADVDIPDSEDKDGGEEDEEPKPSEDDEDEEGKDVSVDRYYFIYMSSGSEYYSYEDVNEDYGDSYLELFSDGTGYMYVNGSGSDMCWDDDEIWPEEYEDEVVELKIKNGIATIVTEGYSMVFAEYGVEVDMPASSSNSGSDEDLAGYYEFSYAEYDGEKLTAADMGQETSDIYLYMYSDGTGYFFYVDEGLDMVWEDGMIWPEDEEDEAVAFEIDGDYLYMSEDGMTMVFEKG